MKVTGLPVDPGPAGWNALLPAAQRAMELDKGITADWLVIGAGFAGLAAARRLTQNRPGDRVVILEASRVGAGPAGRNSGFMIDLPHDLASENYGGSIDKDRTQTADNRLAIDFAQEMALAFDLPREAMVLAGKTNGAATENGMRHNRDYAAHLNALGEPYRMLDSADMREITGSTYYKGGLYTPGSAILQPALFVRGVANGLKRDGAVIYEASPVVSLEKSDVWVAMTPKGSVAAPRVVLAVNGHLNSFGFAKRRLMHVFTYASMTRALSKEELARLAGDPDWGITPADPMGTTVRRFSGIGGDRIIIRNRFTYDPTMTVPSGRMADVARSQDIAFQARFPMLENTEMAFRWGGRLCLSWNDVQIVEELEEGLFAACCQNGLGTVKGTLAGMLAVDMATGKQSDALTRASESEPPKKLPAVPFLKTLANAKLRWGELRAGREF